MDTMTPTRTKRNSKAPNRFSSDNSHSETSNSIGETVLDYSTTTNATNNNMVPTSRATKLKPTIREPLKVKLPKLKRPHLQSTKDDTVKSNINEIKIHKIKLPSFSKKSKNTGTESGSNSKSKSIPEDKQTGQKSLQTKFHLSPPAASRDTSAESIDSTNTRPAIQTSSSQMTSSPISTRLDVSTTSKSSSSNEDKSSNVDSSFTSDDTDGPSRMEIVVSQTESSNGTGIRCPCGVDDDLGVMVECESCSTWQHGHCINVGTEEEAYEGYICAYCALPQDRVRESLKELTVGDKFQSRFKLLESLKNRQNNTEGPPRQQYSCNDTSENNALLTIGELSQSINDLKRVMSSLRAKWRLLTSSAYEAELRIWQNPYWSLESSDKNNYYFLDRCKSNLKLNVCNMITKLEERCRLIDYAISLNGSKSEALTASDEQKSEEKVRQNLDLVMAEVKDFKNKLKTLAC